MPLNQFMLFGSYYSSWGWQAYQLPVLVSSLHWSDYSNLEVELSNKNLQSLALWANNTQSVLWDWR